MSFFAAVGMIGALQIDVSLISTVEEMAMFHENIEAFEKWMKYDEYTF